jgi:hypothetical protein
MLRTATISTAMIATFASGYLAGSVSQRRADAQGIGSVLEQAGKAGGAVGAASKLGSSIVEMEQHVSGLQKNLDTLKQVQSLLTGK